MASPRYEHRQRAKAFLIAMAALVSFAIIALAIDGAWLIVGPMIVIAAVFSIVFFQLRTEVTSTAVVVTFGLGWPRRTIPLRHIEAHEQVRNRWWYGFGIRLIPGGTLFTIWGLDAVEVRYRDTDTNRDRMFRIGTDDPIGLHEAITVGRSRP